MAQRLEILERLAVAQARQTQLQEMAQATAGRDRVAIDAAAASAADAAAKINRELQTLDSSAAQLNVSTANWVRASAQGFIEIMEAADPVAAAIGRVRDAIRDALDGEMGRDERVIVLGEDVGLHGGVFRATDGLLTEVIFNRDALTTVLAHNVGYFLLGRHTGLVPYFFPGVLTLLIFLFAGRQRREPFQWLVVLTLLLASVAILGGIALVIARR
jgi:hypothetical protein